MSESMVFYCENDECEAAGYTLILPPGEPADCPECGWSLIAAYPEEWD